MTEQHRNQAAIGFLATVAGILALAQLFVGALLLLFGMRLPRKAVPALSRRHLVA
jgi:hypothetical protein